MKKIIYTRPDGGLSVIHPVINTYPEPEDITEDEALQRALKDVPAGLAFQVVDEPEIPTDRTFRNAWVAVGGSVSHDMTKARGIQQDILRALRAPKLAALDVEFMRAVEVNDTAKIAEIAAKKQTLRDVTVDQALVRAATPEALKLVIPDILKA